jgi:hypothetical protein
MRGMIMHPAAEDVRQARADARADLVRRLFAVAISIGFGATLARMEWVQNGRLPEPAEFNQTLALSTALLATVLSWDGHLLSMRSTPLFDFWRFLINVALAFIYMFLLMASMHPGCVLWTLSIIFFLHVVWDVLTIREDVASYDHTLAGVTRASATQIWSVYAGDFAGKPQIQPGPVVTLAWTIYFVLLAIIANGRADAHIRTACVFALVGLVGYRLDEARQRGVSADMRRRSLIGAGVLIAALIYFRLLSGT